MRHTGCTVDRFVSFQTVLVYDARKEEQHVLLRIHVKRACLNCESSHASAYNNRICVQATEYSHVDCATRSRKYIGTITRYER
jgi:hypothetical protein